MLISFLACFSTFNIKTGLIYFSGILMYFNVSFIFSDDMICNFLRISVPKKKKMDVDRPGWSMPFLPVFLLRAQHFVRAFEVDGVAATERAYAPQLKDVERFTELDVSMDWALRQLRAKKKGC